MNKKVYKTPKVECREIGLTTVIAASFTKSDQKATGFGAKSRNVGYTITFGDDY